MERTFKKSNLSKIIQNLSTKKMANIGYPLLMIIA
jgi:hypothetical protein